MVCLLDYQNKSSLYRVLYLSHSTSNDAQDHFFNLYIILSYVYVFSLLLWKSPPRLDLVMFKLYICNVCTMYQHNLHTTIYYNNTNIQEILYHFCLYSSIWQTFEWEMLNLASLTHAIVNDLWKYPSLQNTIV